MNRFFSDDNIGFFSKKLILEDLRQGQDDNSIHTTQMISYKKCLDQRDPYKDVTRACVRPLK